MIRPSDHPVVNCSLICVAAVVMTLVMAIPARAGVGLPPMPNLTDTNAMEQYRVKVFYEAQKSEQERLKVGQERYDRMLTNRAQIIQAMASELADREQQVAIPAEPAAVTYADNKEPNTLMVTILGAAVIGLAFIGFRFYLNRQNLKDAAKQT